MRPKDYLPSDVPTLNVTVVERMHDQIGEGEDIGSNGQGTNRSEFVDGVNRRFGSPLGSYWCANLVGGAWRDAGASIPPVPGNCEAWHTWALRTGRMRKEPYPGYATLYGTKGRAEHIAVVARVVTDPTADHGRRVLDIGGNTSLGKYARDGWTVAEKVEETARVIGYVAPDPLDGRP